jgi:hypothetical protein
MLSGEGTHQESPMLRPFLGLSLLAATVGCTSIDSSDLETSGMIASIEVVRLQGGDGTDVHVSLTAGSLNFVDLDPGDELKASFGDEVVTLQQGEFLDLIAYNGHLSAKDEGDVVTVALERADKTPAPSSTATLPALIDFSAPAASTAFSRANDDIVVTVNGEDSDVGARLTWSGDCVESDGLDIPAGQTSITINKGTIQKRADVDENDPDSQPVPDTCTLNLRVRRESAGALDPAYKSGSIVAVTQSSRDLTSDP